MMFTKSPKSLGILAALIVVLVLAIMNTDFFLIGMVACLILLKLLLEELKKLHKKAGNKRTVKQLEKMQSEHERMMKGLPKKFVLALLLGLLLFFIVNILPKLL